MPRLIDADSIKSAKYHDLPYTHIHPVGVDVQAYEMGWNDALDAVADFAFTVDAEPVVRCKDCKYFHYNKAYNIQGFPIMGSLVCDKWGNGCRTDENGYCFLGERKEDG